MKKWQRRTLGLLAILGGAIGAFTGLVFDIVGTDTRFFLAAPIWLVLTPCIAIALYCYGIWCGIALLNSRESAIKCNLVLWCIQIPLVNSSWFSYEFTSGAMFASLHNGELLNFNVKFNIGSSYYFSLGETDTPHFLGLNLFAVLAAFFLFNKLRAKPAN